MALKSTELMNFNWIELPWIELNKLNWTELNWSELNWTDRIERQKGVINDWIMWGWSNVTAQFSSFVTRNSELSS